MLDGYHLLTLTHRHAPLEEIGQAIVRADNDIQTAESLRSLQAQFGWE